MRQLSFLFITTILLCCSCSKKKDDKPDEPKNPVANSVTINTLNFNTVLNNIGVRPVIRIRFSQPLMQSSVTSAISFKDPGNNSVSFTTTLQNADSVLVIQPSAPLNYLSEYNLSISNALKSTSNGSLPGRIDRSFTTTIDSSRKFPLISDEAPVLDRKSVV